MKNIFTLLILLLPFHLYGEPVDVISYGFETGLNTDTNQLHVSLDMHGVAVGSDTICIFDLSSDIKIDSIRLQKSDSIVAIPFKQTETNKLILNYRFKDTISLVMNYRIPANAKSNGEYVFRREDKWYPFNYNDIALFTLTIEPIDSYYVFGERSDPVYTNSYPLIFIPKDIYKRYHQDCASIPIDYYFLSNDSTTINKIMDQINYAFLFYNTYIGQYPFHKLDVVELSDLQCAQSLSSMIIFDPMYFKYYNYKGWSEWPSHELVHQWIGNSIYIEKSDNLNGRSFIEESLTEYLKLMYIENRFGVDSLQSYLYYDSTLYDSVVKSDKDIPLIDINFPSTKEKGIIAYRKGPMVFQKLHMMLGDSKWEELIKQFYSKYRGKKISYKDFRILLGDITGFSDVVEQLDKDVNSLGFDFMKQ